MRILSKGHKKSKEKKKIIYETSALTQIIDKYIVVKTNRHDSTLAKLYQNNYGGVMFCSSISRSVSSFNSLII